MLQSAPRAGRDLSTILLHRSLKALVLCSPWDARDEEYLAVIELIRRFIRDERGATAVEYGLLAALVSLAAGSVVAILGDIVQLIYQFVVDNVVAASAS
jgi:pilus assembly protein Flp/PilA